jgi:hypothetical protein
MILIEQGTDVEIEVEVTDGTNPVVLTGGQAIFAYKQGKIVRTKPCIIADNLVKVKLTALETSTMTGDYSCEFKAIDGDNDIGTIVKDRITIIRSIIPNYGLDES